MRGLGNSILKRWHSLTVSPKAAARQWGKQYWRDSGEFRSVACLECPKFDASRQACGITYGSALRKCVVAAIEAHLHDMDGKNVLEVGFGRNALARNLVRRSGGTWTGIEPRQPKEALPVIGKGGYGHAADIPFPDATFDLVFGIQSIEHWGQKVSTLGPPFRYKDCLAEIHRVIKPNGSIYFDAPVHFHGHEMFIMGDITRITALFHPGLWHNIHLEQWRKQHEPLERFPPPEKVLQEWPLEISSYNEEEIARARDHGTVWLLTICAQKKPD